MLVGLGVGSAVGVAVAPAGAAPTTAPVTLWKLSADWGYPAGPKGRTRCKGRACHLHAANKIYRSQPDAIAGRLHPCCVAQPIAFEVPAATYVALTQLATSPGAALTDLRYSGVAEILASASSTTLDADTPTDGPSAPPGAGSRTPGDTSPAELAATGTPAVALALGGAALVAVGATGLVVARRNAAPDGDDGADG